MLFWEAMSEALPFSLILQLSQRTTPVASGFRFSFRS
jgi:hypothetical protein